MKVKVEDLKPNPYRNMEKYPIDREKTESLKISINETTFWDNILARKVDGEIQIAYGHHRLLALQELGIKEIDIPIKPIDNSNMIRIMANENMDQWGMNPSTTLETVRATRDYLNGEFAQYEKYDEISTLLISLLRVKANKDGDFIIPVPESDQRRAFTQIKKQRVGQTTILKFLGGNWKQWMIQEALNVLEAIKEEKIDAKAIENLPSMRHVKEFTRAVNKGGLSKEKQRKLSKEIIKEETPSRGIEAKAIETKWKPEQKEKKEDKEYKKAQETFDLFLLHTNQSLLDVISRMKDIKKIKEEYGDSIIANKSRATSVTLNMEVLNKQLTGLLN